MAVIDLPQGWTWEGVLARLGEQVDLEESAREQKALVRRRVIRSGAQLSRLVLAYVPSGLSLRGTVAWAEAAGQASFSDVALLKRLRRSGPWLAELAGQLAVVATPEAGDGLGGRRVVAVDPGSRPGEPAPAKAGATAIASPGGRDKRYRLPRTVYDLGAQRFRATQVSDRSVAERLDLGGVEAGEIRLGDRAYGRYRDPRFRGDRLWPRWRRRRLTMWCG